MDYREEYLKEKMLRIKMEADLLITKHGILVQQHEATKKELFDYKESLKNQIENPPAQEEKPKRTKKNERQ